MSGPRRRKFVGPVVSRVTWHGGRGTPYLRRWALIIALAPGAELGVPGVAQRIAEEVESEHGEADREAREHREPGRLFHERAPRAAQHQAPRRYGRLGPHAEKAQRRLDQDGVAEPDRRDDQD